MSQKKYASLSSLQNFLDNLKTTFASLSHKHTMSDIADYNVDTMLSPTSTNPVQNKVIDAEFDAVSDALGALELAIDGKADSTHNHDDKYYTESEMDAKLSYKADFSHNHDSDYDVKGAADSALNSAKTYADQAASAIKNDLLNGAGAAYDTLKELGDLIDDNADAIDALETVATGKADKVHTHEISNVSGLQSALDGKADSSHGTHVSYSSTAPVMDGTASVGSASTVARSDHKHPTDTSRAAKTDLDTHTANTTVHITSTERTNWNNAKTKIDGVEVGAQVNIQSDWNVNNENSDAFIKNRPFYTTDPVDTVIAEGTIPANGMMQTFASIDSLALGEAYNAVFDGTIYNNLICENYDGLPTIMNDAFMFAIQSGRAMAYAANSSVSHTLKVMALMPSVVPLERKYIAEHIDTLAGEKVDGKSYTVNGAQVTAGVGAEVFNDYDTNIASGQYSHAEGKNNIASGSASHAEGYGTEASGSYSHAEGYETVASASRSHAEGWTTEATAQGAHAEGFATHATGQFSHAEGDNAIASGRASHAEGYSTEAVADYSHAEGSNTNASSEYQHVQGRYNVIDTADKYAHIVGNGTSNSSRKNIHTVDWKGDGWFAGDIYIGGTGQDDASASKVVTEANISEQINVLLDNKQEKHKPLSITLAVSNWNGMTQTITINGVTANNTVVITPAPVSHTSYGEYGVYCSGQADNILTFTCSETPAVDLVVNVLILN